MSLLSEEQKEQARNEVFKVLVTGPHSNSRVDLLYAMTEAWKNRDPQEINPSNQAAKILVRYEKYLQENNLPPLKSGQTGGTGEDLLSTIKIVLQSAATGAAIVADVVIDIAKAEFTNEIPTTGSNISSIVESLVAGEGIPQTTPEATPESKAELAKENRLSEQAALMLTIQDILPKITNLDVETTESSADLITPERRIYKNFTTIRPEDKQVGHFFITNNFTKNDEMENFFSKLPPQVLSLLIPSIKMYKTFYPISFQNASKQQSLPPDEKDIKGYDWRIPFDDVPVTYKQETSEFVTQDIDKILSTNGSLHGVGIKSFSYHFKGTNPAEINTNIEASLELFFQNPSDLVEEIKVSFDDPRFQKKVKGANFQSIAFSYSDLINQTSKFNSYAGYSEVFNESYYRIKVECGYADINKQILKDVLINCGYGLEEIKSIRKAVAASRITFYLTPYRHDINFNDDGTINLKIDFIASMDSMMTSLDADLFAITEESKSLLKMIKKYDDYFASKKTSTDDASAAEQTKCLTSDQIKKNIEEFKKIYPDFSNLTDEEIESQLSLTRKNVYNGIFNYLVGIEQLKGSSNSDKTIKPRIYAALYKPQILGIKTSQEDNTSTEQRLEALSSANQLIAVVPIEPQIQPLIEGEQKKSEDQADVAMKSLDEKIAERYKADAEKGIYRIKFILLGDILDIALECLNNIKPDYLAPRMAIGGIPIGIPTKIQEKLNKYNIFTDIKEIYPNLADIPISFDLFQQFMIEHVVRPKKERYPILQFIKDIISDLLIPAISPNVFGQSAAINASIRFSTSYNSFPLINNQDPLSSYPPSIKNFPPIIDKDIISNLSLIKQQIGYLYKDGYSATKEENQHMVSDVNYIFLTCTSRFPKKFDGNEENDIKQGVLHFRMGTDSGIVKRIAFKKANTPFLREMVARREGNNKGTTIRQVYNADVELYGNNIFRPGDYIYIHPNYIFTDKKLIDLETKLGVGGYYLVTEVKTDISDMTFKTNLKCVFQAHIEKEGKNKKVIPINDTCSVSN